MVQKLRATFALVDDLGLVLIAHNQPVPRVWSPALFWPPEKTAMHMLHTCAYRIKHTEKENF